MSLITSLNLILNPHLFSEGLKMAIKHQQDQFSNMAVKAGPYINMPNTESLSKKLSFQEKLQDNTLNQTEKICKYFGRIDN